MRVVVTGGSGRLGRSVVRKLAVSGHDVVSVDRVRTDGLPAEQIEGDLTDLVWVRELFRDRPAEALVHLAAIAVPFSAPEPHILSTNVALAHHAMLAASESGVTRIVAASSPTVLGYGRSGWRVDEFPLDERTPCAPSNAYALSKLYIEQLGRMISRQSDGRVRSLSFRPCYVITPEEWAGAPTQQGHTVLERLDDPALSAPALFNYVDADDAGAFVTTAVEALPELPEGETFFVGASDALAREPIGELLPLYHPGTKGAAASLSGTDSAFSSRKAERLLGWRPQTLWRTALRAASPLETA